MIFSNPMPIPIRSHRAGSHASSLCRMIDDVTDSAMDLYAASGATPRSAGPLSRAPGKNCDGAVT